MDGNGFEKYPNEDEKKNKRKSYNWTLPRWFFRASFLKVAYSGVQSINDAFHNVNKVENVFVYRHIFNLIDNVECVVYALYSSTQKTNDEVSPRGVKGLILPL
jgi:hypothetical protein